MYLAFAKAVSELSLGVASVGLTLPGSQTDIAALEHTAGNVGLVGAPLAQAIDRGLLIVEGNRN
jgi:hypothetical protein